MGVGQISSNFPRRLWRRSFPCILSSRGYLSMGVAYKWVSIGQSQKFANKWGVAYCYGWWGGTRSPVFFLSSSKKKFQRGDPGDFPPAWTSLSSMHILKNNMHVYSYILRRIRIHINCREMFGLPLGLNGVSTLKARVQLTGWTIFADDELRRGKVVFIFHDDISPPQASLIIYS